MKATIRVSVPTGYQYLSLRFFGLEIQQHADGSYSAEMNFDTEEEAKVYLHKRVDYYAETEGTEEEISEMHSNIEKYGILSYDAAIASINVDK